MGQPRLLAALLGFFLVISSVGSSSSREEDVGMRMADDSHVVSDYGSEGAASSATTVTMSPEDGTEYQVYQGVMGRPGVDFPVHRHIPATKFSCKQIKQSGYYADLDTDCQVFHICDGGRKISFLCPNGTIFRQSHLICDWWFRVDCGKSVELYDSSAEQLAADQQIYRARSLEREHRKKQVLAAHGERDIYLDEPYHSSTERKDSSTERKDSSTERKDSSQLQSSAESQDFPQLPPQQSSAERKVSNRQQSDFKSSLEHQNFNAQSSIQPKDSKSLQVEPKTFNPQQLEPKNFKSLSSVDQKDLYPQHPDRRDFNPPKPSISERKPSTLQLQTSAERKDSPHQRQSSAEWKSERNSKRVHNADFTNMYPGRLGKKQEVSPSRETTPSPVTFNPRARNPTNSFYETFQHAASGGLVNSFTQRTQHVFAVDKSLFKTSHEEPERQHFAESASFASHRGGRTFADYNHPNLLQDRFNEFLSTTARPAVTVYKSTTRTTVKTPDFANSFADKSHKLRKTEERLRYVPFSSTSPVYRPTVPILKPTVPSVSSTPTQRSVDYVYFTTAHTEPTTSRTFESTKIFSSTARPELDVSLQELAIQQEIANKEAVKTFTEGPRDGLQVPPSAGPSALRSFALYFAGADDVKSKKLPYLPDNVLVIPIRKNAKPVAKPSANKPTVSKPTVVQQVDAVVKASNVSVQNPQPVDNSLPNSLTPLTKNTYNSLFPDAVNVTESPAVLAMEEVMTKLQGNDLFGSQSRGIVEPDPKTNQIDDKYARIAPDLRELAQVFTKALSAYLDDPEGFRKALSEIRPTEPSPKLEQIVSANPVEYPSATKEEDEVLDFSDVTKPAKRKGSTEAYTETVTEPTTVKPVEISNFVLPLSSGLNTSESRYRVPQTDLSLPYETLDQSPSAYYTPPPTEIGTTNAIAEEINNELAAKDVLPEISSNEAGDSYQPLQGSVDDESRPRYGGFQNNSKIYSPYGAELTSTVRPEAQPTTFHPINPTSALFSRLQEEVKRFEDEEIELVRAVNDLVTRPTPLPLSLKHNSNRIPLQLKTTPLPEYQPVQDEILRQEDTAAEPNPQEINLELSPPAETEPPQGFFGSYGEFQRPTTLPTETFPTVLTTEAPTDRTTYQERTETYLPTTEAVRTTQPIFTTIPPTYATTKRPNHSGRSFERLMELQETLMFNTTQVSTMEKEKAREMVAETMSNMTMTDVTAKTLTMMMELAAKNETYRRLVLLLVNDRSGRNKTVEEARISLLRALLTPILTQGTAKFTAGATPAPRKISFRRGKNIHIFAEATPRMRVTTASPEVMYRKTTARPRVVKTTTTTTTTTSTTTTTTARPSTVIGNLGLIRRTIDDSKTKEVRVNSLDDAILDSDARAIELLRSLYSLAARWG